MWWKQVCRPVTASQLGGALLIKKGCREGAEDACLMYLSERGCHPVASLCCTRCCRLTTIRSPLFSYRWRNVTSCQPPKIKVYLQGTYCYTYCYILSDVIGVMHIVLHTVSIYILFSIPWPMAVGRGRIAFRWLLGHGLVIPAIFHANGFKKAKGTCGQTWANLWIYLGKL